MNQLTKTYQAKLCFVLHIQNLHHYKFIINFINKPFFYETDWSSIEGTFYVKVKFEIQWHLWRNQYKKSNKMRLINNKSGTL